MWGIRFLNKGKEFLAASSSKNIFRFEVATGKVLQKYQHSGTAYRLAVLPDEKTFVGTDGNNKAVLWETGTGKKLRTFSGHTKDVYTAIVVNDGKTLITGSEDESIKQWDLETGKCLKTITDKPAYGDIFTLTPSPDKKQFVAVCDGGYARVFDSVTLEEVWKTKLGEEGEVVAWAPDNSLIASTSDDRNLYLLLPTTPTRQLLSPTIASLSSRAVTPFYIFTTSRPVSGSNPDWAIPRSTIIMITLRSVPAAPVFMFPMVPRGRFWIGKAPRPIVNSPRTRP
jgi:WD40 repeat protein